MTVRLGVLASGRGSNFQAIARAIREGTLDAEIVLLISDRKHAAALDVAGEFGIPAHYLPYDRNDREAFEREAARRLGMSRRTIYRKMEKLGIPVGS